MTSQPPHPRNIARWILLLVAVVGLAVSAVVAFPVLFPTDSPVPPIADRDGDDLPRDVRQLVATPRLTVWWDLPTPLASQSGADTHSNVKPSDYAGPSACQQCHPENHEAWSHHPHHWMNALATAETVRGDF